MSAVEARTDVVERKPRSIEAIIERNDAITTTLITALALLHVVEDRLVGRNEQPKDKDECDNPPSRCHIPILNQQQDKLETVCVEIIDSINILAENI